MFNIKVDQKINDLHIRHFYACIFSDFFNDHIDRFSDWDGDSFGHFDLLSFLMLICLSAFRVNLGIGQSIPN